MILVGSSAWIEFDQKTGSAVQLRLRSLIIDRGPLAVSEPVIMEVLAGARDDVDEQRLADLLGQLELLAVESSDYRVAARIHRRCRRAGFTPRGLTACVIAAVAWRHDAELLARDVDLERIAAVVGIGLDAS